MSVTLKSFSHVINKSSAPLKDVAKVARLTAENTVSIGSSLSHVHVPGRKADDVEELAVGEVEVGMGIHNEAGSEKAKADLPSLVQKMLKYMLDSSDNDRGFSSISKSDETVLLINNLGGVSPLEMGGITTEVIEQLEKSYSIKPVRILSGTYMTSLNGLGFSISLLKVTDTGVGKSLLELLDAPAEANGWAAAITTETWKNQSSATKASTQIKEAELKPSGLKRKLQLTIC